MSELPKGWASAELDDICTLIRGVTFPSQDKFHTEGEGLIPCLRTTNVQDSTVWSNLWYIPEKYVKNEDQILRNSDILISTANSYELVGKVSWINNPPFKSTLGAFISLLRTNSIEPKFLFYQMRSEQSQSNMRAMSSTTTNISNISGAKLKTLNLVLPPLNEQTRIVTKLEELLSDLDAGVSELKTAQAKLIQYRQSLLKAAVEGDESGAAFPKLTLGELVKSIGQGWSPKCKLEAATNDEQWAVMKTTAIQPLHFDGSYNKLLPSDLKPRQHLELESGDLLVTRAGPRNRVGISCLVRSTRPKLILCDKAYRIKCDETLINPEFLELVLNAPHIVQRIDELKTGISDSGLNLTQDRFFTLEIPIPSLEAQQMIIEKVQIQVESIRNQEISIDLSLKQSAAQRKNILRAAFAGELVPQDPNDEPASVLLERIQAERAAQPKKAKGRQTKAAP